jgi:hypothetical protein
MVPQRVIDELILSGGGAVYRRNGHGFHLDGALRHHLTAAQGDQDGGACSRAASTSSAPRVCLLPDVVDTRPACAEWAHNTGARPRRQPASPACPLITLREKRHCTSLKPMLAPAAAPPRHSPRPANACSHANPPTSPRIEGDGQLGGFLCCSHPAKHQHRRRHGFVCNCCWS